MRFSIPFLMILCAALLSMPGCNRLGDPNTIVVAEVDGEEITRGDLFTMLNDMSDTERPQIRTKRDFLRFLNGHIDERLKIETGVELAEQGIGFISKDQVFPTILMSQPEDRKPMLQAVWEAGKSSDGQVPAMPQFELSEEQARQVYNGLRASVDAIYNQQVQGALEQFFQRVGEDREEVFRFAWTAEIPEGDQMTPLMEVYDITPDSLREMKAMIQEELDQDMRRIQGERALAYLANQAVQEGTITIDPEALQREYEIQKENLMKSEQVEFQAIRFPDSDPDAVKKASEVKARVEAGESFEDILQEYLQSSPDMVMQSAIENDPTSERFRGLWVELSGAEVGQLVGPVFMPAYQQIARDANNQEKTVVVPDSYLVLEVVGRRDAGPMTIDEARQQLAPPLILADMMELLRKDHNVVVYEDKLPDPRSMGGGGDNPYVT
jgi:hypothetical protein